MDSKKLEILLTAKDNASKTVEGFGDKLGSLGKKAAVATAALAATATAGIAALGTKAVQAGARLEQTTVAFNTMLGSAEKAGVLLKELSKLASTTPFEINEVRDAARQLLAYGIEQEKIIETTKMLGDVSAGLGKETFPFLTLAFGQIKSKGRLMGQELLQLTNAGFNVAEAMGVTRGELMEMMESAEGVSFQQVEEAFKRATSEGGRFNNMMENQSRTIAGRWSNMKDRLTLAIESLGTRLLPIIEKLFDKFEETLPDLQRIIGSVVETFKSWRPRLIEIRDGFIGIVTAVGNYLQPKLTALWNTIKEDLVPALKELWEKVLKPLLPIIGTALVFAIGLVIDAFTLFLTVMSPVAKVMYSLIGFVITLIGKFWEFQKAIINAVVTAVQLVVEKFNVLKSTFDSMPGWLKAAVSGVASLLSAPFSAAFRVIKAGIDGVYGAITWVLQQLGIMEKKANKSVNYTQNKVGTANFGQTVSGTFAHGGSPNVGRASLVGERGAELFVPDQKGQIIKNMDAQRMMGSEISIVVNNPIFETPQSAEAWWSRMDRDGKLVSMGLSGVR